MKCLATFDSPYSSPGSWNALTSPSNSDRCVCIPEPNAPAIGLGMNVAYIAVVVRDFLGDEPERLHVVGHRERVGVTQVDLVLARTVLVERVLDRDAHRFEPQHGLLAQLRADVVRGEVEVAGGVEGLGALGAAEVEELHLGADEEREALLPGPLEVPLQHVARVAVERLAGEAAGCRRTSGRRRRRRRRRGAARTCSASGLASMSDSWIRL